ncbi:MULTISPECIES: hypothetical protein [Rhodococcus]|jgi:hypothetical protein|uniref:hypothetical protein n=1 Tax=Rhodococcus TaxID=1827 RepID=UPI0007C7F33F|nr:MULTISPECIES: hypothetical protein [Rhodococcus]SCC70656.1 hypothetical protein GA0061093_1701 [Rhodococcus qingshengii]
MKHDHTRAVVDAALDADYIDHTIPADPNAVDSADIVSPTIELDTPSLPPEGDLIEQSMPATWTTTALGLGVHPSYGATTVGNSGH